MRGSVAVLPGTSKEWGFAASSSGRVGAASTGGDPSNFSSAVDPIAVGPVIGVNGRTYLGTSVAAATLRAYAFDGAFAERWSVPIGVNITAPLAIDSNGNVWTGSQDAKLTKTVPFEASGAATTIATLPGALIDSPVILSVGDIVVGDQSGLLHRYSASGTEVWHSDQLGNAALAPMIMTGTSATFIVPTKGGKLFAIDADGAITWSASLDETTELRTGNLYTADASSPIMSTGYFSASNGKLFAVVVDGQLDASAPWPKAFHDPKNTNRAGPQP